MTDDTYTLAPLLYHFAGADQIPAAWAARFADPAAAWGRNVGLARGDGHVMRRGELGPAGVGILVAPGVMDSYAPEALHYAPDAQDWAEFETGAWCGVAKTAAPVDFMRKTICHPISYILKTSRGDWLMPVALLSAAHCNMPKVDQFRGGHWVRVANADFAQLSADAELLYKAETGEGPEPGPDAMRDIAVRAIGANYALTGPEMGLLGLLNDDSYAAIAAILTDRAERQKKTVASAG